MRLLQQIAADHPDSRQAHHTCGGVLMHLGQASAAEPYLRRAVALDPTSGDARANLSFALLAQGDYAAGWPLYEARTEMSDKDPARPLPPYPAWAGEPLIGKRLLIWPDDGLGDQIQFIRFVRSVRDRGADVVICCSPVLQRLFAASFDAPVLALTERMDLPRPDFWTRVCSLPGHLGLTPETGPAPPYLRAPAVRPIPGARIGVVTRGSPDHANDLHRSLGEPLAERLLALPGAISLHPEATGAQDMADTAEIIAGLDLVISVDTSVAHLAAAMGKPTWVLLSTVGLDWRWGLSGDATPWYPTVRLFRQPRINDWPAVIDAVVAATPG